MAGAPGFNQPPPAAARPPGSWSPDAPSAADPIARTHHIPHRQVHGQHAARRPRRPRTDVRAPRADGRAAAGRWPRDARSRRPGRDRRRGGRPRVTREPAGARRRARARCGACAATASTGSPQATRSASRPEMPVPRRSRDCSRRSSAAAFVAAFPAARSRSELGVDRRAEGRARRRTLDRPGRQRLGVAEHQPRLDGAVAAVDLEAHGASTGSPGSPAARAGAELDAARAGAAGGERERDVAALAHRRAGRSSSAAGTSSETAGLPCPNGFERSSSSARLERERVAGRDGVDALDGGRGPRGRACAAAWATNASRNASTRRGRSSGRRRRGGRRGAAGRRRRRPGRRAGRSPGSSGRSRCPRRRRARSGRSGGSGARRCGRRRSRSRPGASPRRRARSAARGRPARPAAPRPRSGCGSRRRGARR